MALTLFCVVAALAGLVTAVAMLTVGSGFGVEPLVVTIALFAALPWLARWTGRVRLGTHAVIGLIVTGLVISPFTNGGHVSVALVPSPLIPVAAALVLGVRAAAGWTAVVLVLIPALHATPDHWMQTPDSPTSGQLMDQLTVTLVVLVAAGLAFGVVVRRSLDAALDEAHSASRAKSDFLATMSHEIRTPMNGVLGMTELLLLTPIEGEAREYAGVAHRSAVHLLTVLNDILDFSKLSEGHVDLELSPTDLRELAYDAAELLRADTAGNQVTMLVRVDPRVPGLVLADEGRVRQVITNLVGNAVKFTEAGHVLVELRATEPDSGGRVGVTIRVEDTGVGIAEHRLAHIFDRFVQADTSTTRRFGGTGLGLAIVRALVERMGGTVEVTSTEGVGTCFTVTAQFEQVTPAPPRRGAAMDPLAGTRLLLVDDHPTSRRVVHESVVSWGTQTGRSASGEEALATLERAHGAGEAYQAAIVAHEMAGMGGEDLAQALRADPRFASMALVALSSSGAVDAQARAQAAGFDAVLRRPARPSLLHAALESALAARARPPSGRPLDPAPSGQTGDEGRPSGEAGLGGGAPTRWRALLVEDEAVNQQVASKMLTTLGCRVDTVANGAQAVDQLHRLPYDVVFMDCQMPELDGYEATARIRASTIPQVASVPIIALTADALQAHRRRALDAGMDDHLAKPIQSQALGAALERWAGTRSRRGPQGGDEAEAAG